MLNFVNTHFQCTVVFLFLFERETTQIQNTWGAVRKSFVWEYNEGKQ